MPLDSEGRRRRARAAGHARQGRPELGAEDRRDLKHDAMARYIREMVDSWPPLTADQRGRLAPLLQGGEGP